MMQLQGAIQYVANRMNGNVNKAMQAHQAHLKEELTTAHEDNQNTIVTGKDIRDEMNREIGD